MKKHTFKTDADFVTYIEELIAEGFVFHLDDNPEDIFQDSPDVVECLKLNHVALWNYANPWILFDKYPDLYERFIT
jgi:hypothetical protein